AEHCGSSRECWDPGGECVRYLRRVESTQLFGNRAVDGGVAGAQSGHVVSLTVCGDEFVDDLVETTVRGVDQARVRRAVHQQFPRRETAGVEAHGAGAEQFAAAYGDQIGRAGTGSDEMHCHGLLVLSGLWACHCTTVRIGVQPLSPPSGSADSTEIRDSSPP